MTRIKFPKTYHLKQSFHRFRYADDYFWRYEAAISIYPLHTSAGPNAAYHAVARHSQYCPGDAWHASQLDMKLVEEPNAENSYGFFGFKPSTSSRSSSFRETEIYSMSRVSSFSRPRKAAVKTLTHWEWEHGPMDLHRRMIPLYAEGRLSGPTKKEIKDWLMHSNAEDAP